MAGIKRGIVAASSAAAKYRGEIAIIDVASAKAIMAGEMKMAAGDQRSIIISLAGELGGPGVSLSRNISVSAIWRETAGVA